MMGHKIWFYGVVWLIIPKLSIYPFLSGGLWKDNKQAKKCYVSQVCTMSQDRAKPENLMQSLHPCWRSQESYIYV